jgi:hypothetical protein
LLLTTLVGGSLLASTLVGAAAARADDNQDRTDSAAYTESRADYWAARAAYEARRAAVEAQKDGTAPDGGGTTSDGGGGGGGGGGSGGGSGGSGGGGGGPVAAAQAPSDSRLPTDSQLAALRFCESSDDYSANTGNGYYGAYQFSAITWWWLGYSGMPNQASAATQDAAVRDLFAIFGWSPWPACSRHLGFA